MPAGTEELRRQNTALVLRSLRHHGPATRAELAKRTGLAKATVGAIVTVLDARLAVDRSGTRSGARGRPGQPVSLRGSAVLGLGLELNVDYVAAVVVDLAGEVQLTETRSTRPGTSQGRDQVLALAAEICESFPPSQHLLVGATVAVPGLVGSDDRTVAWAPNLGSAGLDLAEQLEATLDGRCSASVLNDANCAALAETHHGAATDAADALYLTGTVGIGAGIVHVDTLFQGGSGFAGEVGHMPIGDPEAVCGCGQRGCWEANIGLHAMLAAVAMPELDTPLRTAQAVAERAETEPDVRAALHRLGRDVGLGLVTLANVLDPEVVVLGGYFVPLGEHVLAPARTVLHDRLGSQARQPPSVRLSTLGIHAAAMGAAERSLQKVLTGEMDLAPVS